MAGPASERVRHLASLTDLALDVDGDGRNDIITPQGWFEAPADPRGGDWKLHSEFKLGQTSFLFAIDLNEDGLPDLLTANAHDYGIFWMEQRPDHTWVKHTIDESCEREPLGIYWYEYRRAEDGKGVEWSKHLIDYGSRSGGGKSGLFLFENLTNPPAQARRPVPLRR